MRTLIRFPRIIALVVALTAAACTASSSHHSRAPASPSTTVADFQKVTLRSLSVPPGFHVEAALRFAQFRADLMTLHGNSLFWFDARTLVGAYGYHRIERLDLATLKVSTAFESETPLTGFQTWAHGLIVAEFRTDDRAGCGSQCVQPALEVVDFRQQPAASHVIVRADPQPLARASAIAILSWSQGAIFQLVHHGRYTMEVWRWRSGGLATVRSDHVDSVDFSAVGDVVVGQFEGSKGLWDASLTGKSAPQLPAAAQARGLLGATQGPRLIWAEQPHGTMEHAYASTLQNGRFGPPRRLFDSEIYVLQPVDRCLLILRSPSGLFATNTCSAVASKSRLLTGAQSDVIYNPGRFASRPGRFVFALAPGRTKGPETLVILRTPRVTE